MLVVLVLSGTPRVAQAASSDITLTTATGAIAGTLEMPTASAGPIPVVLIIAGSGPTDRDGNNALGAKTDAYRMLAQALAARGIASVRYDKRGIALSEPAMQFPVTFSIYVDDVAAWVKMLRSDPRFSRVVLVGHSEGSLLALLAAAQTHVDGVVSLAGAGRPFGDLLVAQIQAQGPASAALIDPLRSAIADVQAGRDPKNVPPQLAPLFPRYLRTFLNQLFNIDPAIAARNAPAPLLIVQGGADIQIGVEDATILAKARPDATLVVLEHMTHVLKDAVGNTRAASLATYTDPSLAIDNGVVEAIVAFVNRLH
jgi:pimeloyl-ACP methyl ester carboxylesterase